MSKIISLKKKTFTEKSNFSLFIWDNIYEYLKSLQIIRLFSLLVLAQWAEFFECKNPLFIGNGQCDYKYDIKCNFDGGDCCDESEIGNKKCNDHNNFASCGNYDGGDCNDQNQWPNCQNSNLIGNGECNVENQNDECYFDGGDCCNQFLVGNKECDSVNLFENCGFYDGGDCCSYPDLIGDGNCDGDYEKSGLCNYGGGDCCLQSWIGKYGCQNFNNFASCGNFDGGDCALQNSWNIFSNDISCVGLSYFY